MPAKAYLFLFLRILLFFISAFFVDVQSHYHKPLYALKNVT